jgi:calcium-dependent protein kinase
LKELSNFRGKLKMQQAAMTFISTHLINNEEQQKMRHMFEQMDKDFDGKLSRQEIIEGFKEMEVDDPEGEADKIMANIDFDDNGSIEFTEWCTATMDKRKMLSKERLKAAFNIFDQNGNGSISFEEVKALIGHGEIGDDQFK